MLTSATSPECAPSIVITPPDDALIGRPPIRNPQSEIRNQKESRPALFTPDAFLTRLVIMISLAVLFVY
jgi:hypothetical protein